MAITVIPPKYSDTFNFRTPINFCKNNLFFVPNFGQLVKFLSPNFRTRNYDGLEVQQRSDFQGEGLSQGAEIFLINIHNLNELIYFFKFRVQLSLIFNNYLN